jgi:broad specificity phosphatase PhoE
MHVFVRHGDKEFANGRGFPPLDSPLRATAPPRDVVAVCRPAVAAFVSPYTRCRQTAAAVLGSEAMVFYKTGIAEYLGNQPVTQTASWATETLAAAAQDGALPPCGESWAQMVRRATAHAEFLRERPARCLLAAGTVAAATTTTVTISHGVVLGAIYFAITGHHLDPPLPPWGWFAVDADAFASSRSAVAVVRGGMAVPQLTIRKSRTLCFGRAQLPASSVATLGGKGEADKLLPRPT